MKQERKTKARPVEELKQLRQRVAELEQAETERKRAEDEIKRLAKFPSENPNPVLRVAKDGTILYANNASLFLLDIWGCQVSQPLPDHWHKFTVDILSSGVNKDTEVEIKDRILSLTFAPVVDADYVNVYGIDITERKRAEEEMRTKMRHISTIHEAAQLAMDAEQPKELAYSILRSLSNVMPTDAFAFDVWNPATNELVEILQADIIDGEFKVWETNRTFPLENKPLLSIFKTGEPIIELRKPDERIVTELVPFGNTSRLSASIMFAPMCHKGETKGIVTVQSYTYNAYNHADLELFADVANVVGVALSRLTAEDELRKSEEIYRKAISFAQGVPYQRDYRLGAFTFVGEGITELTGYSLEEFNAGVFYKIAQETILRGELAGVEFEEALRRARARQVNKWQADYRILTRDGQTRWISDSAVQLKDTQGKVVGSMGILQDITERKQAEEALRESEEKYRSLFENMHNGFAYCKILIDENNQPIDFVYLEVNDAFEKLTGLKKEAVTGKKVTEAIPGIKKAHPELFDIYGKVALTGKEDKFDIYFEPLDIWLSISVYSPQKGYFVAIFDNITDRKRAEEALHTSEEQLRQSQKMEAIGRLAGGVAHDFNNLLTAITGYTELLLNRVGERDPLRRDLEEIYKAAEAAASLTRRLLAFSRRQVLQPRALDLNAVITDIKKMLRRLIGEDINLVTALEANLDRVKADRGQIEQVIMNLAVNARDAMPMPEGGNLIIKTENVTLDEDSCRPVPEALPGKFVCLSVADTGAGMDKEIIPHIFEPFFSTKKRKKGTGLGLSVVYGIVKQHEGWINVYSEPGQGSTFKVYLPTFSIKQKDRIKETIPLPKLQGHGERILLVEDEQRVREFAARVLRENGYVVFNAANAKEALDTFEREKGNFHLVFADMVLPDKSGSHLCDRLLSRKPELSVLLCSGYTDKRSQWPLMREKGFRFLQKPYALADLLQAIRAAIRPKKTKPEGH